MQFYWKIFEYVQEISGYDKNLSLLLLYLSICPEDGYM